MRRETRESLLYGVLGLLGEYGYDDAEEVLSVDERTKFEGGCDTCSFEYQVLDVRYRRVSGGERTVTVEGSLSELLNAILAPK